MRISPACAPTSPAVPLKHMAWKVLARGGEAAVRSYSSLAAQPEWLDWSFAGRVRTPRRASRSSACGCWRAKPRSASYGLRIPGKEIAAVAAARRIDSPACGRLPLYGIGEPQ